MPNSAAALIIGNEVLSGKVREENAAYLVSGLRMRGIELRRIYVVPDEEGPIVEAVLALKSLARVVFTSGGLGPTHDDITVAAVAKALNRPVVRFPEMEALVREYYGARLTDDALRLADAPQGAVFERVKGVWIPVLTVENLVLLPGLPELFRLQFDGIVERYRASPIHLRCLYLSAEEVAFASLLHKVAAAFPEVRIGSYPVLKQDYEVKLTFEGRDAAQVNAALHAALEALPTQIVLRVE
jgi:molybdenum cofactor synthesis domain-containing protein